MPYTPMIGGDVPTGFASQFDIPYDFASFATTPIELLALDGSETVLSHGTGFFWSDAGRTYLVTARHVLSGFNPFTDELMDATAFRPSTCTVYPAIKADGNISRWRINLSLHDLQGNPYWREDPEFPELRTDIAALLLPAIPSGEIVCLNETLSSEQIMTFVGMDCSILGYPNRNYGGLLTPLWRRATIASEPSLAIDGKPMFLVDGSTSPGFSGAPVLRRHVGPLPTRAPDGSINIDVAKVLTTNFVGVYAGRLQNRTIGGEVPFVFYANRLPLILANPRGVSLRFRGF